MQSWKRILDDLPCDRKERASLDRFIKTPESQGFLPVYEILKRKGYPQEAFELLVWGHRKFPNYGAARAILARELYQRGLIQEAWETLQEALATLNENILAQKILFKSSVLCGEPAKAGHIWQNMKIRNQQDPEISRLANTMKIDGLEHAQNELLKEFTARGIDLPLPSRNTANPKPNGTEAHSQPSHSLDLGDQSGLESFQTLPLSEIFRSKSPESKHRQIPISDTGTVEDRTMAELYKKQGLLEQAMECYKRILISSPNSDHAKRSILELQEIIAIQAQKPSPPDPSPKSRNENSETDSQFLYERMLNKLERSERPE